MTTLDTEQWVRPHDIQGMHQLVNDIMNALWGYSVGQYGPVECVKALRERADRLAAIVDEDAATAIERLTAQLKQTHEDLSHMRVLTNIWELRAQSVGSPADVTRWAHEDMERANG